MFRTIGRPLRPLAMWLGGWGRLLLLALAVAALAGGVWWERWRHPPLPPGAAQAAESLNPDFRQTTYRHAGPAAAILAFYQQTLPPRGWSYCGTQASAGCSNLPSLAGRPGEAVTVYRRSDDADRRGATIEIWPIDSEGGQVFVTVYETRGP